MERIISYNKERISIVSDSPISVEFKSGTNTLLVGKEFETISNSELINDWIVWDGKLQLKNSPISPLKLRIAFISNYGQNCGISTYSEKLYNAIIPLIGDCKIFAEGPSNLTDPLNVIRCWNRGESTNNLVTQIHQYDPDIILIQHEYGLWNDAKIWLSLLTKLSKYKVYVILHSVYESHDDKTICESAIKNIIVHTNIAYECLKKKGLTSNIFLVPHGCDDLYTGHRPWNMYKSENTIVQFGFGFRYKGWENSLKVIAELKKDYPDIFFTGIFNQSEFSMSMHNEYFNSLLELIDTLNIGDNVGFIRNFINKDILMKTLCMNRLALFPYIDNGIHTVFGCSGASREALTAKIPVIVSTAPLFDDIQDICPRCANIEEIVNQCKLLLNNQQIYKAQVEKQNKFVIKNSWNNSAKLIVALFQNFRQH